MKHITIIDLVEKIGLEVISGKKGLNNKIIKPQITTPGVELAGYFDFFEPRRLIVLGKRELNIIQSLEEKKLNDRVDRMFREYPPAFIFSCEVEIPEIFIDKSEYFNITVLKADKDKTAISSKIYSYLDEIFSKRKSIHGVFLDIHGIGVLIKGDSGIGKSEIALDLIGKGHILIADDRVEVYQKEVGLLVGEAPDILKQYMEIRGIGVVNVVQMFGAGAFRNKKKLRLIVELEHWDEKNSYDRLGLMEQKETIFDTEVTKIKIPLSPGRSASSVVEAATMNFKLKYMGYNSAKDFNDNLNKLLKG